MRYNMYFYVMKKVCLFELVCTQKNVVLLSSKNTAVAYWNWLLSLVILEVVHKLIETETNY